MPDTGLPAKKRTLHLSGVRHNNLAQARGRIGFVIAFLICIYLIAGLRALDLSVMQSNIVNEFVQDTALYSVTSASDGSAKNYNYVSSRKDIFDRNGILLARSVGVSSLYVDPALVLDATNTAKDLIDIFPDLTYGNVLKSLQSKRRFVWLKRNLTPNQQSKVLELGNPALNFRREENRIYPQGAMASHLIGASGIDGQGLLGIERSFNRYLSDTQNQPLYLTLDSRIQHVAQRELQNAMDMHHAKGGAAIVMDVKSGELLAGASLPHFSPDHYQHATSSEKFNRMTMGVYELGSTFKIFSTAAYLETHKNAMNHWFDARKSLEVGRFKIRDFHAEKRQLSLPEVFIHSSNIGSALMGQKIGSERLQAFYKDLGLMDKLSFEIPEVGAPLVPSPWREINTMTSAYGHGLAVSPLQLISAVSSVVNGGIQVTPTMIRAASNPTKTEHRILSEETSHRMRQLLRLVVSEGTGGKADVPGFLMGGKTGTAEKPGKKGYDRDRLISSFVGVFPIDAPRYAVYVMLDEPKGIKETYGYATGGWVAAPVVAKITQNMTRIMGIDASLPKEKPFEHSLLGYVNYSKSNAGEPL